MPSTPFSKATMVHTEDATLSGMTQVSLNRDALELVRGIPQRPGLVGGAR